MEYKTFTRHFLDEIMPDLQTLEKRADYVTPYSEAVKLRSISESIRAEVCKIVEAIEGGTNVTERIKAVKKQIRIALSNNTQYDKHSMYFC